MSTRNDDTTLLYDDSNDSINWENWRNNGKSALRMCAVLAVIGMVAGLVIIAVVVPNSYTNSAHLEKINRLAIRDNAPGCNLDCGRRGSCQFADGVPYCHCSTAYATFPESLVGFHATCVLKNGETVCEAPLTDGSGRKFVNVKGACTYQRRSQIGVALSAWLGDGVGASWFYMVDTYPSIDDYHIVTQNGDRVGLPWNGGYIAGGIFSLFTGAYLGIGWLINGIRCLIAPDATSIPYWDAVGFAPEYTVNMWNRMDNFVAPARFVAEAVIAHSRNVAAHAAKNAASLANI